MKLSIHAVGSAKGIRFYMDYPEGRLHILNERSLIWNLKKVFGFDASEATILLSSVMMNGSVSVELKQAS